MRALTMLLLALALALSACGADNQVTPAGGAATVAPVPTRTANPNPAVGPTPTLQALVANTIPLDGQTFTDQLPFNTSANDPAVGSRSGAGIQSVTFQFFGPDRQEVFRHTETTPLYCAFGGGDNGQNCDSWLFSEHANRWPNGNPAQAGKHTIVATVVGTRGTTVRSQRTATLQLKGG